jgi:hypothetical protein
VRPVGHTAKFSKTALDDLASVACLSLLIAYWFCAHQASSNDKMLEKAISQIQLFFKYLLCCEKGIPINFQLGQTGIT